MKRALWWSATWVVSLGGLTGCPVYPEDGYACIDDMDCPRGAYCEYDDDNGGRCVMTRPKECYGPADCPLNYTCTRDQVCRPGSCIFDGSGCAPGYACMQSGGVWACVRPDPGTPLDAGNPPDGGQSADASPVDAGEGEDGATDAGLADALVSDGATEASSDAGRIDAGRIDAGRIDAGRDAAR